MMSCYSSGQFLTETWMSVKVLLRNLAERQLEEKLKGAGIMISSGVVALRNTGGE